MGIAVPRTPREIVHLSAGPDRSGTRVALTPKGDAVSWTTLVGPSLDQVLAVATPAPLGVRLRILFDAVLAVAELHENSDANASRRCHGHISPADIVVGLNGLSQIVTVPKDFCGKSLPNQPRRGYLAPELLLRKFPASRGTDVFALGVCLWETLASRRLFPEQKAQLLFNRIRSYELPVVDDMPGEAWALLMVAEKAFGYYPKNRYSSATQMLADMHQAAGKLPASHADVANYVQRQTGLTPEFTPANSRLLDSKGPVTALSSRCAADVHPSPISLPRPPALPSLPEMEILSGIAFDRRALGRGRNSPPRRQRDERSSSRPTPTWDLAPDDAANAGLSGPRPSELPTIVPEPIPNEPTAKLARAQQSESSINSESSRVDAPPQEAMPDSAGGLLAEPLAPRRSLRAEAPVFVVSRRSTRRLLAAPLATVEQPDALPVPEAAPASTTDSSSQPSRSPSLLAALKILGL